LGVASDVCGVPHYAVAVDFRLVVMMD
jgi:hypothetical protein